MTAEDAFGFSADAVARALKSMFGPDVAVATGAATDVWDRLFPQEQAYIAAARGPRRAEFGTARVCARRALTAIGIDACPLVPHPDRAPSWPTGVVGAISHAGSCVAVAVTRSTAIAAIGVDLEEEAPLDPDLEATICTAEERAWLAQYSPGERGSLAKAFFSAKEAFYKAQYPLTHAFLEFHDVTLRLDPFAGTFSVADLTPAENQWDRLGATKGRYRHAAGLVIATAIIPAG